MFESEPHFFSNVNATEIWLRLRKTGRREANPGRACRPSRSEFSVVFSRTHVNMGKDALERPPLRALPLQAQVTRADNRPYSYNNKNKSKSRKSKLCALELYHMKMLPEFFMKIRLCAQGHRREYQCTMSYGCNFLAVHFTIFHVALN